MKHQGEKHYASLPQELKKWYGERKARGYPKISDYDDCYEHKASSYQNMMVLYVPFDSSFFDFNFS